MGKFQINCRKNGISVLIPLSLERVQVIGRIRKVDIIGVRGRSKSCVARPREHGKHAVSRIRRVVNMKIVVKESKRGNIAAMRKRLKTVSQRRGVDKTKSF